MKKKILIVDAAEINRAILLQIFEEEYEVLQAEDGATALAVMYANIQDLSLVIMDMKMPDMDGFALMTSAKNDPLLHMIPLVVAADKLNSASEMRALELGAADFIIKPYNVGIIRQRIRNMIDMHESMSYKKISERDRLTGIYNRERFYERTSELLHSNPKQPYMIYCLNIDKFKLINDLFGTTEGDKLLIYIAKQLSMMVCSDSVYGRLTADNFAVCTRHPGEEGNEERITEHINAIMDRYPLAIRIVVRCGFYLIHDIDIPIEIMCDRANMAIMEIKGSYSKRFSIYDDKIRHKILQEQEIINEMKRALDEQQFAVYYQPKYNMETRKIIGAEALVRWVHPIKGIISPGIFIPVFEKNGFISSLDTYVWERTCQDIRDWIKKGYIVNPISVNVSRAELYNNNLCIILQNLIQKYAIPIHLFQLEITESAYTENPEQLIESVDQLKAAGFSILMDDFGSGYSSLNTLKDVPVDVLKLDLKFLYNMDENIKANYILKSVVQMAKRLELTVIAEGVETEQQADFLLSIGCVRGQGYLFAKPMTKVQYTDLISVRERVSQDDDDENEGIFNIDDVMSKIHREDEVEWYRAAVCQMHVMLVQYEVRNDTLTLFDLRSKENANELSKMEIPNFHKVVLKGRYIYPDDIELTMQMLQSRQNQTIQIRARHYLRNNGYVWCEVSGRWVYDEEDSSAILNCVVRELTEQKMNEAMLGLLNAIEHENDSEKLFRRVIPQIAYAYILGGISMFTTSKKSPLMRKGFRWTRDKGLQIIEDKVPLSEGELQALREMLDDNHVVSFRREDEQISRHLRDEIFFQGAKTVVISSMNLSDGNDGILLYFNMDTQRKYANKEMVAFAEISKCIGENMKRVMAERKKIENLQLFETAFQQTALQIWEYDIEAKTLICSKSVQEEFHIPETIENVPESLEKSGIIHKDFIRDYREMYRNIEMGKDGSSLFKWLCTDGAFHWFKTDYSVIKDANDRPVKAVAFGENIKMIYENQRRMLRNLHYRDPFSRYASILFEVDLTEDRFLKITKEERSVFRNARFSEGLRDYSKAYVLPEYRDAFLEMSSLKSLLQAYREGKQYVSSLFKQKNEDGREVWVDIVAYLGYHEESKHIRSFAYVHYVNDSMEWIEEAGITFQEDPLTRVANKECFETTIRHLLSRPEDETESALIIIDLDEFRIINEQYGDLYGDEVLANAAAIIKANIPLHSMIGRINGDRFYIFVYECISKSFIYQVSENLVRNLFASSSCNGKTIQLTASVGVTFTEDCGRDYDKLVEGANEFVEQLKFHK